MTFRKFNLGYSLKNIPIPAKDTYIKQLINQTEKFLKRLRWKVFFFDQNQQNDNDGKETFGFRTPNTPPQHPDLNDFENDIYTLIGNIDFKDARNSFQSQLNHDIRELKKSGKLVVCADKTTNLYHVDKADYNKLISDNITKDYKKAPIDTKTNIDKKTKQIVDELELSNRMEVYTTSNCFIKLKDHKDGFQNNPKCRLINPAKTDIGKVSKQILEKAISTIRLTTQVNQWRNTAEVLSWFSKINKKRKSRFIQFDIEEFYPSISSGLLDKAITYAKTIVDITDLEVSIIKHSKTALLFDNNNCWIKKSPENFDVTMGSWDGAETCELVGLYLLSKIGSIIPEQCVGLYRDDGLALIENANGPMMDRIRKDLHKCFKDEGLKIKVDINMQTVDFLDTTLNIIDNSYKPYRKPNDTPLYVHKHSNHPPSIIKNLPEMINKRLSNISSNKTVFDQAKGEYERALRLSGYNAHLEFNCDAPSATTEGKKKRRQRKVMWYNPPFSSNVSTDIGRRFFALLDKHFPTHNKFHKIINRNTVKLSYSSMPNLENIIQSHNKRVLDNIKDTSPKCRRCNCRNKANCPLDEQCLTPSVIYEATAKTSSDIYNYIGLTEGPFKTRFNGHKQALTHDKYRHSTELSKKVWELKDNNIPYNISWKILQQAHPYKGGGSRCDLCLSEKLHILRNTKSLNKRSELVSKCRHARKYLVNAIT